MSFLRKVQIGVVLASTLACSAWAQKVTIVTEEYPPYNFQDPATKKISGMATEVVQEVFKRAKIENKLDSIENKKRLFEQSLKHIQSMVDKRIHSWEAKIQKNKIIRFSYRKIVFFCQKLVWQFNVRVVQKTQNAFLIDSNKN